MVRNTMRMIVDRGGEGEQEGPVLARSVGRWAGWLADDQLLELVVLDVYVKPVQRSQKERS